MDREQMIKKLVAEDVKHLRGKAGFKREVGMAISYYGGLMNSELQELLNMQKSATMRLLRKKRITQSSGKYKICPFCEKWKADCRCKNKPPDAAWW